MVTEVFNVGWPNAPHRVLRSAVDAAEQLPSDALVATVGERRLPVFAPVPPTVEAEGTIDAMALYAGLSASDVFGATARRRDRLRVDGEASVLAPRPQWPVSMTIADVFSQFDPNFEQTFTYTVRTRMGRRFVPCFSVAARKPLTGRLRAGVSPSSAVTTAWSPTSSPGHQAVPSTPQPLSRAGTALRVQLVAGWATCMRRVWRNRPEPDRHLFDPGPRWPRAAADHHEPWRRRHSRRLLARRAPHGLHPNERRRGHRRVVCQDTRWRARPPHHATRDAPAD